jgi:hypothetical protein
MSLAQILGQAVIGWILADFVTGAFHWWEDCFGRAEWPVIGPWLIAPNRLHHTQPLAFTRHGFWARNGASVMAAAVIGSALCWALGPSVWLAALCLGGALANEVHRYAHEPSRAPRWILILQQVGMMQSPKEHARHHRPPYEANYCVLTDWLNPLFEATGFWRGFRP